MRLRPDLMHHGAPFRYSTIYPYGTAMRYVVRFLRQRGRILPWREVINRAPKYGDLRIEECRDEELRRSEHVLDVIPVLAEVHVQAVVDRPHAVEECLQRAQRDRARRG